LELLIPQEGEDLFMMLEKESVKLTSKRQRKSKG
jgi:hypothetical protein